VLIQSDAFVTVSTLSAGCGGPGVTMRMRAAGVLLAASVALLACGDDDGGGVGGSDDASAATTASLAATEAASDAASAETASSAATAPAPETTAAATDGDARCDVTITGAVTAEWSSDASGYQAFVFGGWLPNPAPDEVGFFGLNCYDSDFNLVGFLSSDGSVIPMEPATYEITGSFDPPDPIGAEVALLFDDGFWETTSGTLDITDFDDSHIEGTFSLQIEDSSDPSRTAEVAGSFAYSR
jgi:hypothetical protein